MRVEQIGAICNCQYLQIKDKVGGANQDFHEPNQGAWTGGNGTVPLQLVLHSL